MSMLFRHRFGFLLVAAVACATSAFSQGAEAGFNRPDAWFKAQRNLNDLRISTYATAARVRAMAEQATAREEALQTMRRLGVTRIYLEVYRGGTVLTRDELVTVRDFFRAEGVPVVGGIATVPGGDTGVRANEGLGWFNWQAPKTQRDLAQIMRDVAPLFDRFIVDDFLCTGDKSAISDTARGDRSWADYRRDLMTTVSQEVLIGPAKKANPDLHMIVKYPQWYDRFHLFGYDVERFPSLYDEVYVGTETRGQYTQRFGFTQPYEGFVNYRWLSGLAGDKIGGAWFDHGDCDAEDFVEQAWQTVLAGANEIVLFNLGNLMSGHAGPDYLVRDFPALADLARTVKKHPVVGVSAYKPPHSDAGTDLYVMDHVGMLGVPLVPTHRFPADARVLFLPTQAAADKSIGEKVKKALESPRTVVFTAGFLAASAPEDELWKLAGLNGPVSLDPKRTTTILHRDEQMTLEHPIGIAAHLDPGDAEVLLTVDTPTGPVPYLTAYPRRGNYVAVLNCYTYSQDDFDAVGEVLLSPARLGMLEVPETWANTLRQVFNFRLRLTLTGPARVTLQPLDNGDCVVQNYTFDPVTVSLSSPKLLGDVKEYWGRDIERSGQMLRVTIPARNRAWLRVAED